MLEVCVLQHQGCRAQIRWAELPGQLSEKEGGGHVLGVRNIQHHYADLYTQENNSLGMHTRTCMCARLMYRGGL